MENVTVEFSVQELQVLAKLLDLAVKNGGLPVAGDAAVLFNKISAAVQSQTVKKAD